VQKEIIQSPFFDTYTIYLGKAPAEYKREKATLERLQTQYREKQGLLELGRHAEKRIAGLRQTKPAKFFRIATGGPKLWARTLEARRGRKNRAKKG